MENQKGRLTVRVQNQIYNALFAREIFCKGVLAKSTFSAISVEKDGEGTTYVNPIRVLNTK
jgi:hypothetical protein